ncbi:hypothetical protein ADUPG1_000561 [Aduncisulcus paluster]|uniref:Poly(A) polymerase RNA-binding domain-containing protein n=1 Tax=Aduncisulcus paluster TaxID=2918883 RepID=A0ABQ5KBM7_9EUKA|nr:hypothetical protein ADUPG1_000561 [Aduncisulcus paluster]
MGDLRRAWELRADQERLRRRELYVTSKVRNSGNNNNDTTLSADKCATDVEGRGKDVTALSSSTSTKTTSGEYRSTKTSDEYKETKNGDGEDIGSGDDDPGFLLSLAWQDFEEEEEEEEEEEDQEEEGGKEGVIEKVGKGDKEDISDEPVDKLEVKEEQGEGDQIKEDMELRQQYEEAKAKDVAKMGEIKSSMEAIWESLFEEFDFFSSFKSFLLLRVSSASSLEYRSFRGLVEAHARQLLYQLEDISKKRQYVPIPIEEIRIYPKIINDSSDIDARGTSKSGWLCIGLKFGIPREDEGLSAAELKERRKARPPVQLMPALTNFKDHIMRVQGRRRMGMINFISCKRKGLPKQLLDMRKPKKTLPVQEMEITQEKGKEMEKKIEPDLPGKRRAAEDKMVQDQLVKK